MFHGVGRLCELCQADANTFCPADKAFLCWKCDAHVHQTNLLSAKHIRFAICSQHNYDNPGDLSSSSESDHVSSTLSCATSQRKNGDANGRADSRINSSQACGEVTSLSSQKSPCRPKKKTSIEDFKAKKLFLLMFWYRILGLSGGGGDRAVRLGKNALAMCWNQMSVSPLRVRLAASLWYGLKFCGDKSLYTQQTLKRLEQISGVQSKLILDEESRLERVVKIVASRRQRIRNDHHPEEGFGESES